MDRRRFLNSLLGGAVAASQLDIEKLLWLPGKKTIFVPLPKTPLPEFHFTGLAPRYWETMTEIDWPAFNAEMERYWNSLSERLRAGLPIIPEFHGPLPPL